MTIIPIAPQPRSCAATCPHGKPCACTDHAHTCHVCRDPGCACHSPAAYGLVRSDAGGAAHYNRLAVMEVGE